MKRQSSALVLAGTLALIGLLGLGACGKETTTADQSKPAASTSAALAAPKPGLQRLEGPGYTIDLPGKATKNEQTAQTAAGPMKIEFYVLEIGRAAYAVSTGTLPEGAKGDLDGAVAGSAQNVKGVAHDVRTISVGGFPGRDARITVAASDQGPVTVFTRILQAGETLIQVQLIQPGADVAKAPAQYADVIDSLKIG